MKNTIYKFKKKNKKMNIKIRKNIQIKKNEVKK